MSTNRTSRWLGITAGLGVASLALAACSSSASGSPGGSSGNHSPVTIGVLAPLTGTRSNLGHGMQLGAQIAVAEINKAGGVNGHKLQFVSQDTAADPADAVPAAQQEISSSHVAAFVGPTAITAGVTIPLAQKAKIPDLMWGGGSEFDKDTNPFFFRMSPSDTEQSDAMVYYAHSKGWNRVALAFGASSGSQALVPGIIAAARHAGMQIVANVTLTSGASSYRSEIAKVFAAHPQVVLAQFNNTTAGVVFGELSQEGLTKTPWIGTNLWYTDTWFKAVGASVASGPIYITNSSSTGMLGAAKFIQLLKQKTGSNVPANGEEFIYDAVITWALGADEAGTWNWPAIRTGILKAADPPGTKCGDYAACLSLIKKKKDLNWEGSVSTVDFNKYDNVYGPFAVLHYSKTGSVQTLITLSATQLQAAFSS